MRGSLTSSPETRRGRPHPADCDFFAPRVRSSGTQAGHRHWGAGSSGDPPAALSSFPIHPGPHVCLPPAGAVPVLWRWAPTACPVGHGTALPAWACGYRRPAACVCLSVRSRGPTRPAAPVRAVPRAPCPLSGVASAALPPKASLLAHPGAACVPSVTLGRGGRRWALWKCRLAPGEVSAGEQMADAWRPLSQPCPRPHRETPRPRPRPCCSALGAPSITQEVSRESGRACTSVAFMLVTPSRSGNPQCAT